MGMQAEIVVPRYVVLTRMADSWIPRASLSTADSAEAEAFRWRRIYGPARTKVAEYLISERASPDPITVPALPVELAETPIRYIRATAAAGGHIGWYDAALRAMALYLGFGFANRAMELLILLAAR
jgi:hypothetical protein